VDLKKVKVLRNRKNWKELNTKLKTGKIVVLDNLLTDDYLFILRNRILNASKVDDVYNGYKGTDHSRYSDIISIMIADNLLKKLPALDPFERAWSFIYDHNVEGVRLHADPSTYNLNIWVTPNKCLKDKKKNGLEIYKLLPPKNWTRADWNANPSKVEELIKKSNVKPTKYSYKYNRGILFNGAYFHRTAGVSMKDGLENRRISFTMLFGKQLNEELNVERRYK
jgi:hypothetical protein|tara:strand:+ start:80 stop:751 length:672 start_codon:yes stop_codon:yes gene_type:complete